MSFSAWVIIWLIQALILFGLGVIYRGRKIGPIISILKDTNLNSDEKIKKLLEILL